VKLGKQNLIGGDRLQELEFFYNCILEKSHKLKFEIHKHVSNKPFEYAHVDLWGPMRAQTYGEGSYLLKEDVDLYLKK